MKNILLFLAFCFIVPTQAQTVERFYKGISGKKIKLQGQKIDLETCDSGSQTTLSIDTSRNEESSESKKFSGSCSDRRTIQLSDKGVLMFRMAKFGDTLIVSKYSENGRMMFKKSTVKRTISRFQPQIIPFNNGGFIATYITYPPAGKTQAVVGCIFYNNKGVEIAQKTVDSLVDASPSAVLLEGANDNEFYILQATDTQCGKFKLHKMLKTTKVWTTTFNYDLGCDNMVLQSFAMNNQNTLLGLLFVGATKTTFNKYFLIRNGNGAVVPTNIDISSRVHYNTKTAFGKNNEVYFVRVVDYNTSNSSVADRSALEILQFDVNQNRKSQKRYFDAPKNDTDTVPQLEDVLVTNDGTVYITGSRLKKTWLFKSK